VPTDTFAGEALYQPGQAPSDDEIKARRSYWQAYHDALAAEIARLSAIHGTVILWDAHSIASEIPALFEGRLPDFNLGTFEGKSCDADIAAQTFEVAKHSKFSAVLNGRFKGGYITRHYGNSRKGVNAIQLEMAQAIYMDETPPFSFHPDRAERVSAAIKSMIKGALAAV
jgi:N-formylglutamate deformylase